MITLGAMGDKFPLFPLTHLCSCSGIGVLMFVCRNQPHSNVTLFQLSLNFLPGVHDYKMESGPVNHRDKTAKPIDPIKPVAEEIAEETWLLCFDEFQV